MSLNKWNLLYNLIIHLFSFILSIQKLTTPKIVSIIENLTIINIFSWDIFRQELLVKN